MSYGSKKNLNSQKEEMQVEKIGNKVVSRMDYTKHLMKRTVETSSCGTYISLGIFAAENVGLLLMPLLAIPLLIIPPKVVLPPTE
jgi:hypothetical protein